MRKLLFKSLLQAPLTEPPPAARRRPPGRARAASSDARPAAGSAARLSIREVDAGSCNGCELEIHALNNAFYDSSGSACASWPRRAMPTCCS